MLWPFAVKPRLDWIQVEVTTECPASCRYCPRHVLRDRWIERRLPFETYEALLEQVPQVPHLHLQGWGEPLMHPRLLDMIRLAAGRGHNVSTTTNAMLMNEERADALVGSGLEVLAFSLAGLNGVNDCIRRGTRFAQIRRAIAMVRDAKARRGSPTPRLHVAYMLLRSRLDDVEQLPAMLRELRVDEAVVSSPSLVLEPAFEAEACLADDEAGFVALEARLRAARDEAERLGCALHFHLPALFREERGCSENVARACVITSAGEIVPCVFAALPLSEPAGHVFRARRHALPSLHFGSLSELSLAGAWSSKEYRAFRRMVRRGETPTECSSCMKRFIEPLDARPELRAGLLEFERLSSAGDDRS